MTLPLALSSLLVVAEGSAQLAAAAAQAVVLGTMGTPALPRVLALLVRGLVAGTTPSMVATKKLTAVAGAARVQ